MLGSEAASQGLPTQPQGHQAQQPVVEVEKQSTVSLLGCGSFSDMIVLWG